MKTIHVLASLLGISILSSCIETVSLDTGEKNAVTVNCILTQHGTQSLDLSFARKYFQPEQADITEAEVSLFRLGPVPDEDNPYVVHPDIAACSLPGQADPGPGTPVPDSMEPVARFEHAGGSR